MHKKQNRSQRETTNALPDYFNRIHHKCKLIFSVSQNGINSFTMTLNQKTSDAPRLMRKPQESYYITILATLFLYKNAFSEHLFECHKARQKKPAPSSGRFFEGRAKVRSRN